MATSVKARGVAENNRIGGIEKAVAILLSLEREKAIGLLRSLRPDDIAKVMALAETPRRLDFSRLASTTDEFESLFLEGMRLIGSTEEVSALISQVDRPAEAVSEKPPEKSIWERFGALPDDKAVAYLSSQAPSVATFICANMSGSRSSELLKAMAPDAAAGILARIATMKPVSEAVRRDVEEFLRRALDGQSQGSREEHLRIAGIINRLDATRATAALAAIEKRDAELARAIRKYLFRFEQLLSLPKEPLALLVDRLSVDALVTALQGMPSEFQAGVLATMAPRARRLAESELQGRPSSNPLEVNKARLSVTEMVLKMVSAGDLDLEGL